MPQLAQLPRQVAINGGSVSPGAKLYTYQTLTNTPQLTYSDIALTIQNPNPIVADGVGMFPKIYLDGSLPNYRFTLQDQFGVQIYQEDDIPSGNSSSQNYSLTSAVPYILLKQVGAAVDNGVWRIRAQSQQLHISLLSDSLATENDAITISRTGTTPGVFAMTGTSITLNGLAVPTYLTGSITPAWSGYGGSPPTGKMYYTILGDTAFWMADANCTGTSTSTSLTIGNIPAGLMPATRGAGKVRCLVTDNGAITVGAVDFTATSTMVAYKGESPPSSSGFTAAAAKGFPAGSCLSYKLT